jgi:hypothetical protein
MPRRLDDNWKLKLHHHCAKCAPKYNHGRGGLQQLAELAAV